MKPIPKFLVEFGPLLAFFIGNWKGGVFWGTGIFMGATAIALIVSWVLTHKIAKFPLFSAIFVGIFGGLTIYLHDDTFIKVKVTLINLFFGADNNGRTTIDWGSYGVPETFIVDGKGVIRFKWIGPLSPEALKGALSEEIEKARRPL